MREDNGSNMVVSIGLVCEMRAYKSFLMFAYFILMIVLSERGVTWRGTSQRRPMESC